MQSGFNQTLTLENKSTISSRVNQTGKVNDPSLSNRVSCKRLHIIVMESYVKYLYLRFIKNRHLNNSNIDFSCNKKRIKNIDLSVCPWLQSPI